MKLFHTGKSNFLLVGLLGALLSACLAAPQNPPQTPTDTPQKPVSTRSIDKFIPPYNPQAVAVLPPDYSVSGSIWPQGIPARPIGIEPQFINSPAPASVDNMPLIKEAGRLAASDSIKCSSSSPLSQFNCDYLDNPGDVGVGTNSVYPVIAQSTYGMIGMGQQQSPMATPSDRPEYLFQVGCLGRGKVGYIFKVNDNYVLVTSAKKMQELFAPIDNPTKALSYAQMLTGLEAIYSISASAAATNVFFQKTITGTHVIENENGYLVNLYQHQFCGCNAYMTSQVNILIDRAGELKWGDTTPIYLDVIEGQCVD